MIQLKEYVFNYGQYWPKTFRINMAANGIVTSALSYNGYCHLGVIENSEDTKIDRTFTAIRQSMEMPKNGRYIGAFISPNGYREHIVEVLEEK